MTTQSIQATQDANTVVMQLPAQPEYISLARLAVSSLSNMVGFPIDEIEDLKVALSEACTNAMQYGCKNQPTYTVAFKVGSDELEIVVHDSGEVWDISAVEQPATNGTQVGGFGLYIIRTLMDDMKLTSREHEGTVLTMKKLLRPQDGLQ